MINLTNTEIFVAMYSNLSYPHETAKNKKDFVRGEKLVTDDRPKH